MQTFQISDGANKSKFITTDGVENHFVYILKCTKFTQAEYFKRIARNCKPINTPPKGFIGKSGLSSACRVKKIKKFSECQHKLSINTVLHQIQRLISLHEQIKSTVAYIDIIILNEN